MANHFQYRGVHYGVAPRARRHQPYALYMLVLALAAIVAFAWTRQPVTELLPIPHP
jgi:hypothetical protein